MSVYMDMYIYIQWKLVFEFYCVIIIQTRKLQTHSFILIYFRSQLTGTFLQIGSSRYINTGAKLTKEYESSE